MPINNTIIIIEDDAEDQDILRRVLLQLKVPNALKFFHSCDTALQYLLTSSEKPFIILSDINLPGMTGLELLKTINADRVLRKKCVPFVFLSTSTDIKTINLAYEMSAQGYFAKAWDMEVYAKTIHHIIDYWKNSESPFPQVAS